MLMGAGEGDKASCRVFFIEFIEAFGSSTMKNATAVVNVGCDDGIIQGLAAG